jgi:hypothetical protein
MDMSVETRECSLSAITPGILSISFNWLAMAHHILQELCFRIAKFRMFFHFHVSWFPPLHHLSTSGGCESVVWSPVLLWNRDGYRRLWSGSKMIWLLCYCSSIDSGRTNSIVICMNNNLCMDTICHGFWRPSISERVCVERICHWAANCLAIS